MAIGGVVKSLQGFDVALNHQDLLLVKRDFQFFLETCQELSGSITGRDNAVDYNFVTVGDSSHLPQTGVWLWEKGKSFESLDQDLLQPLELFRFNRIAIVIIQGDEIVILFHQSRPLRGWGRSTFADEK